MSEVSPLREMVRITFARAFGPPHREPGGEAQWSLRPPRGRAAINIRLDTRGERPAVWVFDPNDPRNGVAALAIRSETDITPIVEQIEDRIRRAGRAR
jgi:hypothetical protein